MAKHLSIFNSKKVPGSLIIILVMFILFELTARLFFRPQFIPENIYIRYSPQYDYGYDTESPLFYQRDSSLILYSTSYLKFWQQEMPVQRKDNEFRIFTIGCSVSRGDYNSHYSYYLQKLLNEDNKQHEYNQFNVVNCSASGIGSSRILLIFKKILKYKPDFVILHPDGTNEFEDERDLNEALKVNSSYQGYITKSWFFCILKKYVDRKVLDKFKPKEEIPAETYARWFVQGKREEWLKTLQKNMTEMVAIAQQNNIPILFVGRAFNADTLDVFEDAETRLINNTIKSYARENVYVLDSPDLLLEHFGHRFKKDDLFMDTVHWLPKVHQLVAHTILDTLRQNQIIENFSAHSAKLHEDARLTHTSLQAASQFPERVSF